MNAKLNEGDVKRVEMLHAKCAEMKKELAKRVVGQDEMVDQVLTAVFARGHALLTGVPGLAKTLLVRTLAEVMDLGFKRVQFTPDLMPADVTGTEVLDEDRTTGKHVFRGCAVRVQIKQGVSAFCTHSLFIRAVFFVVAGRGFFKNENVLKTVCSYLSLLLPANACYNT